MEISSIRSVQSGHWSDTMNALLLQAVFASRQAETPEQAKQPGPDLQPVQEVHAEGSADPGV